MARIEPLPDPSLAESETRSMLLEAGAVKAIVVPWGYDGTWQVAVVWPNGDAGAGIADAAENPRFNTPQELAAHLINVYKGGAGGLNDLGPRISSAEAHPATTGTEGVSGEAPSVAQLDTASVGEQAPDFAEQQPNGPGPEDRQGDDQNQPGGQPEVHAAAIAEPAPTIHPGIMVLPDEIGELRNVVRGIISETKMMRLDALAGATHRSFLAQQFVDYTNLAATGAPLEENLRINYYAYMALSEKDRAINDYALSLERATRDADGAMLRAMVREIEDGWPT